MRPARHQVALTSDAAADHALGKVRAQRDDPLELLKHATALVLAPVAAPQIGIETAGLSGIGRLARKGQPGRSGRVDLRAVDDGDLGGALPRQLRRLLVRELRPPSCHQIVVRGIGVPAHQRVDNRCAGVPDLEERPVLRLVAGNRGARDAGLHRVLGRVDRQFGTVVRREEDPQVWTGELRVPDEADRTVIDARFHADRIHSIRTRAQHQGDAKNRDDITHRLPRNRVGSNRDGQRCPIRLTSRVNVS